MLYLAKTPFGATSIMGIFLSSLVLRNKPASNEVIVIHRLFPPAGLGILLAYLPAS
jgi:hypothetical protein